MDHSPILAIIVPCFCEEEVLPSTNERLRALLADIVTRDEGRCDGSESALWQ